MRSPCSQRVLRAVAGASRTARTAGASVVVARVAVKMVRWRRSSWGRRAMICGTAPGQQSRQERNCRTGHRKRYQGFPYGTEQGTDPLEPGHGNGPPMALDARNPTEGRALRLGRDFDAYGHSRTSPRNLVEHRHVLAPGMSRPVARCGERYVASSPPSGSSTSGGPPGSYWAPVSGFTYPTRSTRSSTIRSPSAFVRSLIGRSARRQPPGTG